MPTSYVAQTIHSCVRYMHTNWRLRSLCGTRLVENHDAVLVFEELLIFVDRALGHLSCSDAASLLAAIRSSVFFVSLVSASCVMVRSVSVSKTPQKPSILLGAAYWRIFSFRNEVSDFRSNAEIKFGDYVLILNLWGYGGYGGMQKYEFIKERACQ